LLTIWDTLSNNEGGGAKNTNHQTAGRKYQNNKDCETNWGVNYLDVLLLRPKKDDKPPLL